MQYKVVFAENTGTELAKKVQTQIKMGWKPIGGVAVVADQGTGVLRFYQAMIKE